MARTGRVNHTHKYFRHENGLWYCSGKEGCSHYIPKNMPAPAGRMSDCWACDKPFMLTPVNMTEDKPKCDQCSEELDILGDYLEKRMPTTKKMGLEAFGAKPKSKPVDEIEIFEPYEEHAPECEYHIGRECNCK